MSIIKHLQDAKRASIIKSMMNARYTSLQKLQARLKEHYKNTGLNEIQRQEINRLRTVYAAEQRRLLEKYIKLELEICDDFAGKYQPKIKEKL